MIVPSDPGHDGVVAVAVAEELVEVIDVIMTIDVAVPYELELGDEDAVLVADVGDEKEELPDWDDVPDEEDMVELPELSVELDVELLDRIVALADMEPLEGLIPVLIDVIVLPGDDDADEPVTEL